VKDQQKAQITEIFRSTYGREPEVVCHAPGRIEFIGNHTDYNGGPVLGVAIDRGITVAAAGREDPVRRLASDYSGRGVAITETDEIQPTPRTGDDSWTNYPLGIVDAFPAFGLKAPGGFDYLAASDLPVGSGLSSSAAIELATGLALLTITGQTLERADLVKLGRHAENTFVGVPCGILDQGVVGFGRRDHLVRIDCRTLEFGTVPMPAGLHFWILNSHANHALVDGLYAARHQECMDGAKALKVEQLVDADIDALEAIRPDLDTAVYLRSKHVIDEIARVHQATRALVDGDIDTVGDLLTASHRSSRDFFENSTPELDYLVDRLIENPNVHGARLTGGGFGGAVMALTDAAFDQQAAEAIAETYRETFDQAPDIIHLRSADGAGVL
jgi:galactokinase